MRLTSYRRASQPQSISCAVIDTDGVAYDVWDWLLSADGHPVPMDDRGALDSFLERSDWWKVASATLEGGKPVGRLEELDLAPIVVRPRNLIVVAANTQSHLDEAGGLTKKEAPLRPVVLMKSLSSLAGPNDDVPFPMVSSKVDYEAEIGVIIGATCRRVPRERAHEVIAGYTVINDFSARDYQLSEWEPNTFYRTHFTGKSFDGFCPAGPVMVTTDEVTDLGERRVRCWVNGELRQDEAVSGLYFSVPEVIEFLSSIFTLHPGDLLLMGTPSGVGAFSDPPRFLNPGDVVRCEVTGIGTIENRLVDTGEETHISSLGGRVLEPSGDGRVGER
jgi:2-keto-4-pentenoate hydratase/2-oxohepta-3-ene-1,7-dioic acid hydratase in catechol pathway